MYRTTTPPQIPTVPVAVGSVSPLALHGVPRVEVPGADGRLKDSTKMMLAMSRLGKRFYEGTVPAAEIERRRRRNKAARAARRVHRG